MGRIKDWSHKTVRTKGRSYKTGRTRQIMTLEKSNWQRGWIIKTVSVMIFPMINEINKTNPGPHFDSETIECELKMKKCLSFFLSFLELRSGAMATVGVRNGVS